MVGEYVLKPVDYVIIRGVYVVMHGEYVLLRDKYVLMRSVNAIMRTTYVSNLWIPVMLNFGEYQLVVHSNLEGC